MDFVSIGFLVFLVAAAFTYRICPARFRAGWLLALSYAFYCSWSPSMALLLACATAWAFIAARRIESSSSDRIRRSLMIVSVGGLVAMLALFKSASLLRGTLQYDLMMPVGISYYTFKLISYIVDVYWRKTAAEPRFIPFAAYAAFFPQILAGPIQRSATLLPQIHGVQPQRMPGVVLGIQRILLGVFKKLVVADNLARLVNFIYNHLYADGTPAILGFYAYPIQLYADFSGLTDIAVGAALMLGFESPENFNAPFWAATPSEFWRRWHVTLTSWLTDYVFIPLRMATRDWGNPGLIFSLAVNLVLIGAWHAFRWSYVLFGLVHAVYLSIDALTMRARQRYYKAHPTAGRVTNWVGPVVTFHLAAAAFVVFRADHWSDAIYLLAHLGKGMHGVSTDFLAFWQDFGRTIWIAGAAYLLTEVADYFRRVGGKQELIGVLPRWRRWTLYSCTLATAVLVISALSGRIQHTGFIYAIF